MAPLPPHRMIWDLGWVADLLGHTLAHAEKELREEQAVHGLDTLQERDLQRRLAAGLRQEQPVAQEREYPSSLHSKRSHRLRCDLVVGDVEHGPQHLLWLEVKVAYQFCAGGMRHPAYGARWRGQIVADLRKLAADPLIREAALVLIVFNESAAILAKDLDLFEAILVEEEVMAGFRHVRSIAITDRIGHRLCSVALWPTVQIRG